MKTGPEWVLTTVDGKVAGAATDFRVAAEITGRAARLPVRDISEITSRKITTEELLLRAENARWEDLLIFGTPFQKKVWHRLFLLTHPDDASAPEDVTDASAPSSELPLSRRLYSYSDFAELCGSPAGVRAVAHAVGCNPISVIIPCHLIVPKETIDKLREIENQAAATLFGSDGLRIRSSVNFGEYRCGKAMKRKLILGLTE